MRDSYLVSVLVMATAVAAASLGGPSCEEGAKHRLEGKCSGYMECVKGRLESKSCWVGQRYDPKAKECRLWFKVNCDKFCKEGERRPAKDDCSSYEECVDGAFVGRQCPQGRRFDPKVDGCTDTGVAVLGSCREYEACASHKLSKTKCWWWMRFDPVWGQCRMFWKVSCEPNRKCEEFKRRAVPGSCSDYEECDGGKWTRQTCLLAKRFDSVSLTCVKPKEANCAPQTKLDTVCTVGQKRPDPTDCQKYFECVGDNKVESKSCWTLMRFDPAKSECRMRWNVDCGRVHPDEPSAGQGGQ